MAQRVNDDDEPIMDEAGNPKLYQVRFNPMSVSTLEEVNESRTLIVMNNGDTYYAPDHISAVVKTLNPARKFNGPTPNGTEHTPRPYTSRAPRRANNDAYNR